MKKLVFSWGNADTKRTCLLDVLQDLMKRRSAGSSRGIRMTYHVTMPIERLYTGEKLLVVAQGDEDLCMIPNSLL